MSEPQVYQAITKFRNGLLKAEAASAQRLVNAYGNLFRKLQDDIRALEADIADLGEHPTRGQVAKLSRYQALLKQTTEQMNKYAATLETEVSVLRQQAIQDALKQNKTLVQAALPTLPQSVQATIMASFNRLNPQAIETLLGALAKDSPLTAILDSYGADAAAQISDVILQGVALGYNPTKVASRITQMMGGNLTRALTISRTEMLRAYRTANIANYQANSDIVKGWKWSSTQDRVCCLACLALDGQEFPLSESYMPAHPNCRCAPTPITVSYKDLGLDVPEQPARQTASEWFDELPDNEKEGFFSKAGWSAYQDGAVSIWDFVGKQTSKAWGDAYVEKPLKEILGNDAAKYYN